MITIVDLETGNLQSVLQAFSRVGVEVGLTGSPDGLARAEGIVLPGVGAFAAGMEALRAKGFEEPLRRLALDEKKPLLGICLGMQYLAEESSEHGSHKGLGFIPGRVERLKADKPGYRLPNMGWCDLKVSRKSILFPDSEKNISCYFVHSYWLKCARPDEVAATIEYSGRAVTAAVQSGNLTGCQFHPEKSQEAGLDILHAFVKYVRQT